MEIKEKSNILCRETSALVVRPRCRAERQTDAWLDTPVSQFHVHLELLLVDGLNNTTGNIFLS